MSALLVSETRAAGGAFDYASLSDNVAAAARDAAARIRERIKGQQVAIFDIGRDLIAMKEALGHGHFLPWIEAEFGLTARTAQNFMSAAERFSGKYEIVSHLPQVTIYQLSAASTPDPVRQTVIQRLEAGEKVDPIEVRDLVREAKEAERRVRDVAKLSPSQRRHRQRTETARQREDEERRLKRERDLAAASALVDLLRDRLGDEFEAFVEDFRSVPVLDFRDAIFASQG